LRSDARSDRLADSIRGEISGYAAVQAGTRRSFLFAAMTSPLLARSARAALPAPTGAVVLTVTGAIDCTNADGSALFDLALLDALGRGRLRTWTPWTEGERLFEGVLGRRLMAAVCARGERALARARNDYLTEIPLEDFTRWPVLLATHMDGARLRLRDKGPIWVVYPWSDHPELNDRLTRQKSIWQLASLVIE
jgi:hypothetical protein